MEMNYIGFLSEKMAAAKVLSGAAFKLMWALLYKWNNLHRKDGFNMTDEKLLALSGVKSRSALLKAKKELRGAGLIVYSPSKKRFGTTYWITKSQKVDRKKSNGMTKKKATTEER